MTTLSSTIAGSWYPGSAVELRRMLNEYAAAVPPPAEDAPVPNILILPHAGYAYSAATALYAVREIMAAPFHRVVVLAPSHRCACRDVLIAPESDSINTPFGDIPVDRPAIDRIARNFAVQCSDAVHAGEHAAQIEYPLLQYALQHFQLVPLIVGELSETGLLRAAAALREILDDRTLLVISSDFTHYGAHFDYLPFARQDAPAKVRELDRQAFDAIAALDGPAFDAVLHRTGATICGRNPLRLLLALAPPGTRVAQRAYTTSADATGDAAEFVCYLAAVGYADWQKPESGPPDELSGAAKKQLLQMARRAIEHALTTRRAPATDAYRADATPAMRRPMGCFVTLTNRRSGHLRGCIGEIEAQRPLFEAVTARAIDAAFRDPRFYPLAAEEWPEIRIEISALTPEHPVTSWRDIQIGRHGMTLAKEGHMAVFLPQVAPEQGWDLETTLTHLAQKAGLGPDDWRQGAQFTVFEAIVFHEE